MPCAQSQRVVLNVGRALAIPSIGCRIREQLRAVAHLRDSAFFNLFEVFETHSRAKESAVFAGPPVRRAPWTEFV
jgi:hypothetical protein